ncbi:MAG: hypothetical protein CMP68_01125 [Flavobacteriales bacterium]|nr:hypothetical protein [Flavobacteriales bacterium]
MIRFNFTFFSIFFLIFSYSFSQSGTLKGRIIDGSNGESIPMVNITLLQDGSIISGASSDMDGYYTIKPIPPGKYTVEASFIGYQKTVVNNVLISPNKITAGNYELLPESTELGTVNIIESTVPLIDPDKSGAVKTKEQITALPTRNVQSVAATTAGIFQADEGSSINIRGSRSSSTDYYVDGIKITGNINDILPQDAIDQMTVITGGLPAKFGDATGGIVSVTTRGISSLTKAGIEVISSNLTDSYNYNLISFNASGPILRKKDESKTPIIGYLITGEYNFAKDWDPSATSIPVLNKDYQDNLNLNPLEFEGIPNYLDFQTVSSNNMSEYTRADNWELQDVKPNSNRDEIKLQGKLDFRLGKNINFTVGGSFSNKQQMSSSWRRSLFNNDYNYEQIFNNLNAFARVQHKLSDDDATGSLKNVFYTLQAGYSLNNYILHDPRLGDNFFEYGYVGKFNPTTNYQYDQNPFGFETKDIRVIQENGDTIFETHTGAILQEYVTYDFEAGSQNPIMANYTQQYIDYFHSYLPELDPSRDHIIFGGGMINGDVVPSGYSIFYYPGTLASTYWDEKDSRIQFSGSASADIGNHALEFGFEYERQRRDFYSVIGNQLWTLGRQYANQHLQNKVYFIDDALQNQYNENFLIFSSEYVVNQEQYSYFGQSIRDKFNIADNEWVYIDQYSPDQLSIDMFSADELMNQGGLPVYYYGYDYLGNPVTGGRVSFDEFINETYDNGEYMRRISPYEPIYTAGYIQDKFFFDDIVFNVGVRISRFDANQEVLKDKYSLYPVLTAEQVDASLNPNANLNINTGQYSHPANIGGDFVVYANSINDQNQITGYRDGDNWYDANGLPITDPSVLNLGSGVIPFLEDPEHVSKPNKGLTGDAFEDYTPQVSVEPRISFNFPISDQAMFFAHYDILTQRPQAANRMNPYDYLFIAERASEIQNPNLKMEKTIDYEVGFKQALTDHSALQISAFYKNLKDMVQLEQVAYAYPQVYTHFNNIDFGNVKGFSFNYEVRRTKNLSLNANYTLQFADGTGSSASTAENLIQAGFPNLRVTLPLDFDQRHSLNGNIDFRYGSGTNYNGPILFGTKILQNFGANLNLTAGSGTPYSAQTNATTAQYGIPIQTTLDGSVNGSRQPWSFRADLKINKEFSFDLGTISGNDRKLRMNAYVWVQNLFNTQNIIAVYDYTGNADDDGFLSSNEGIQVTDDAIDPTAFRDQYSAYVNNPNNFSRPRTIRLGLTMNF